MTGTADLSLLAAGVMGVLALVSVTAAVLGRQQGHRLRATAETLGDQAASWWTIAALLFLAMLFGREGVVVLSALVSFTALRELLTLAAKRRADHNALAAAFFLVLPVQYWLVWIDWYGLFSIFVPVYAFLVLPMLSALRGDPENFLVRVSEAHWALMIAVFAASHVPALMSLPIAGFEGRGVLLIAFLILVVQTVDLARGLAGIWTGQADDRRAVAACLGAATVVGAALWWITPFSPWAAAAMALMIATLGYCGGLVMEAIRHDTGVQASRAWDASGGVVDRIDSVVFAAPVFFHVTRFFWAA